MLIKSLALESFTEAYSLTNQKKYDVDNNMQKHLLFRQFVNWSCDSCSVAPLTDYINSPIYQEFNSSDESIYLDLRASYGIQKKWKN